MAGKRSSCGGGTELFVEGSLLFSGSTAVTLLLESKMRPGSTQTGRTASYIDTMIREMVAVPLFSYTCEDRVDVNGTRNGAFRKKL